MRKAIEPAKVIYLRQSLPYARRAVGVFQDLTCLALCKHGETEKAFRVSDNCDLVRAVWCPRSLLVIDPAFSGEFIVATMSKRFAEQKGLWPRAIDTEGWLESRIIALHDAERRAATRRNQLRGHRGPLGYTRNVFA